MAYPKIVYNSLTLNFSYPGRRVPDYEKEVIRHDNIASSRKAELVFEGADVFLSMDIEVIPQADLAAWESFLDWALQGNTFDYYPDADVASSTTYTLENKNLTIARRTPGTWSLAGLKFRQWV